MTITVGIIGIEGRFGSWLKKFFEHRGDIVIGSDRNDSELLRGVVEKADVVIFATPIRVTTRVIKDAIAFSRNGQLWMDVTSIKSFPIEAMLRSKAEVVGLHPLFAPSKELNCNGKTIVVCRERLSEWRPWLNEVLLETKAQIRYLEPVSHDQLMLVEQNLVHMVTLMMASVVRKMEISPEQLFEFSTPLSRMFWASMGRVLSQDPDLYLDIQIHNPETAKMISACIEALQEFSNMVAGRTVHRGAFLEEFSLNREYFGDDFLEKAAEVFNKTLPK